MSQVINEISLPEVGSNLENQYKTILLLFFFFSYIYLKSASVNCYIYLKINYRMDSSYININIQYSGSQLSTVHDTCLGDHVSFGVCLSRQKIFLYQVIISFCSRQVVNQCYRTQFVLLFNAQLWVGEVMDSYLFPKDICA